MKNHQLKTVYRAQENKQDTKTMKAPPKLKRVVHENIIKGSQERHSWCDTIA